VISGVVTELYVGAGGPSAKEKIIRAAEWLFGEYGVDNVSLRQIGLAAGNLNNSAVQYHFGSKDQLIDAIFALRHPKVRERHLLLLAKSRPDDVRGLVEVQARTLFEQSELEDSHFMSFTAMLLQHARWDIFERQSPLLRDIMKDYYDQLRSALPHIDEPLRSHRIATAMGLIVHAASDREGARRRSEPLLPFAVELANLIDGLVGFLQAPVSAACAAAVKGADPADVSWRMFL
jgi:AcrR family transcriptional regulator